MIRLLKPVFRTLNSYPKFSPRLQWVPSCFMAMDATSQAREAAKFKATFERVSKEHLSLMDQRLEPARVRYQRVFDHNCKDGKQNRGKSVVSAFLTLNPNAKEEEIELARVVGWCIELLQSYLLVEDDIEDGSETRRGKVCWYKVPDIGLTAINDAGYLESMVFQVLKRYLKDKPQKWEIIELFLDHNLNTIMGQTMDMTPVPFEKFSMESVAIVYEYKTAYYSFSLPIRSAMYICGITDSALHKEAEKILLKIGHFFQVQDDYLDCFGDPAVTGKIGTDIQDSKCTWLVVTALEHASKAQKKILKDNYGKGDEAAVQAVKNVYQELGIKEKFLKYEEEQYNKLMESISLLGSKEPKLGSKIFEDALNQIYKRQK